MEIWFPILTLVLGAALSAVGTYLGTTAKWRLDYDADLRARRIAAYLSLWSTLQPPSLYGRTEAFDGEAAELLAQQLRSWYFTQGGLFLSTSARGDYFALQQALARLDRGWGWTSPDQLELTAPAWEFLRLSGSRLRTGLTLDTGTRSRPRLPAEPDGPDRSAGGIYERDDRATLELTLPSRFSRRDPHLVRRSGPNGPAEPVTVRAWWPDKSVLNVLMPPEPGTGGRAQERVILIEPGTLIEGPATGDDDAPAVAWRLSPR